MITALPGVAWGAACSKANLTRCLDSACAINVSSNPAARCQYCGTASAGEPPKAGAMRSVSVGASSKNTISDKELKSAPSDPGERYAWASAQCIKKLPDCTPDDIEDTYDSLIEQSCKAAGISSQMAALQEAARKTKSKSACDSEIRACVVDASRCSGDYRNCENQTEFDRILSECGVAATGCDQYIAAIRIDLTTARDAAIKGADEALAALVASYQSARERKLTAARATCKDNSGREDCIATVCERSMPNKCAIGHESEKAAATQLCKFYDTACATLR